MSVHDNYYIGPADYRTSIGPGTIQLLVNKEFFHQSSFRLSNGIFIRLQAHGYLRIVSSIQLLFKYNGISLL